MIYFAYGSNMAVPRLQQRVPSAKQRGMACLNAHDLRFHKMGQDGSGKCDAFYTGDPSDYIYGVLFDITAEAKKELDKVEGLGIGYDCKSVSVKTESQTIVQAYTYIATRIDGTLEPFSWYLNHVLFGAQKARLPADYIERKIKTLTSITDPDKERDKRERALYHGI